MLRLIKRIFRRKPPRDKVYLKKLMKVVATAIDTDVRRTI